MRGFGGVRASPCAAGFVGRFALISEEQNGIFCGCGLYRVDKAAIWQTGREIPCIYRGEVRERKGCGSAKIFALPHPHFLVKSGKLRYNKTVKNKFSTENGK